MGYGVLFLIKPLRRKRLQNKHSNQIKSKGTERKKRETTAQLIERGSSAHILEDLIHKEAPLIKLETFIDGVESSRKMVIYPC